MVLNFNNTWDHGVLQYYLLKFFVMSLFLFLQVLNLFKLFFINIQIIGNFCNFDSFIFLNFRLRNLNILFQFLKIEILFLFWRQNNFLYFIDIRISFNIILIWLRILFLIQLLNLLLDICHVLILSVIFHFYIINLYLIIFISNY